MEALETARRKVNDGHHTDYHELMARIDTSIANLSNNRRLAASLDDVWSHLSRIRAVTCTDPIRLNESIDRRLEVLRAILAGDTDAAEYLAAQHVDRGFSVTVERIALGSDSALSVVS